MKKKGLLVIASICWINAYADTIEQGAEKYDWQTCVTTKTNDCITSCVDSENINCNDNCRDLAADKCISEGISKP